MKTKEEVIESERKNIRSLIGNAKRKTAEEIFHDLDNLTVSVYFGPAHTSLKEELKLLREKYLGKELKK
jgi:hypothetical protein